MYNPPIPTNESERIEALRQCYLLDSVPENSYDAINRLIARYFHAPLATISFIDTDREWYKSRLGIPFTEVPRNFAFCAYAVLQETPSHFIVPDMSQDSRFASHPSVAGPPFVRFYAAAAIIINGLKIGTLCCMDTKLRPDFTADKDLELLTLFAAQLTDLIQERRLRYQKVETEIIAINNSTLRILQKPLLEMTEGAAYCQNLYYRLKDTNIKGMNNKPATEQMTLPAASPRCSPRGSTGSFSTSSCTTSCTTSPISYFASSRQQNKLLQGFTEVFLQFQEAVHYFHWAMDYHLNTILRIFDLQHHDVQSQKQYDSVVYRSKSMNFIPFLYKEWFIDFSLVLKYRGIELNASIIDVCSLLQQVKDATTPHPPPIYSHGDVLLIVVTGICIAIVNYLHEKIEKFQLVLLMNGVRITTTEQLINLGLQQMMLNQQSSSQAVEGILEAHIEYSQTYTAVINDKDAAAFAEVFQVMKNIVQWVKGELLVVSTNGLFTAISPGEGRGNKGTAIRVLLPFTTSP